MTLVAFIGSTQYFLDPVKIEYLICTKKKNHFCVETMYVFSLNFISYRGQIAWQRDWFGSTVGTERSLRHGLEPASVRGAPLIGSLGPPPSLHAALVSPLWSVPLYHIHSFPLPCSVLSWTLFWSLSLIFFPHFISHPHRYVCLDHPWVVKNMHTLVIVALLRLMGVVWL